LRSSPYFIEFSKLPVNHWVRRTTLRGLLAAFLFASFASASTQTPPANLPPACGPNDVSFNVKLDKSPHPLAQPEPGKARIYFLQDLDVTGVSSLPTAPTMFGVDGVWMGAIHGSSYFSVSIAPGEHHLCAAVQFDRGARVVVLAHLQTVTGGTYFYRMWLIQNRLTLDPVDSDEGGYLIGLYPLSISHPKK
jgi:hypothetical protein